MRYGCATRENAMTTPILPPEPDYNPMQQAVLDALGKSPDWVPLPRSVVDSIRNRITDELADVAGRYTPEKALWISKQKLNMVHGCEAQHMAARDTFEWNPNIAKGTVLHKAVELGVHWRGDTVPADIVDEAIARLADSNHNIADYLASLSEGDRAQLRSYVVDMYTRFEECFPRLKPAWRPVTESAA
ncbi:MAG: hypothetical protein EBV02_07200, partial [Actinobacteria bacterium]|nr:hypothetical protein [Actinomycetota bacterium]